MFRKQIERAIDERTPSLVEAMIVSIQPAVVVALKEGHTALAESYAHLEKRHRSLCAAFTAVVGTDFEKLAHAQVAYGKEWQNPKPDRYYRSYAVDKLLKEIGSD